MTARRLRLPALSAQIAALVALGTACNDGFPSNAYRFTPPAQYALWWSEAEACSGTTGDISRVRWYRTPEGVELRGAPNTAGQYDANGHRIALVGDYVENARVVRHEMLHALHPTVGHPRELFLSRCGDVVPCTGDCRDEAGSAPTISATVRRILPTDLEVSIHTVPSAPHRDLFDGHFVLVVVARNPFNEQVMVNFPDSASLGGRTRTFGYRLGVDPVGALAYYHGLPYDRSAGYFKANESKRAVYDYRIQHSTADFPRPGPYHAFGVFGKKVSDTIRFVLGGPTF